MLLAFLIGLALIDMGESLRQLSEVKDAFDLNVRQNFLDPLDHLKNKDLKEINVSPHSPMIQASAWLGWNV